MMYKHILISTDGSEVAQKGVDHGLALAGKLGAEVLVVTVTERFPLAGGAAAAGWMPSQAEFDEYDARQKADAESILGAVKEQAGRMGLPVKLLHVPDANPAEAILEAVTANGIDLVVMSSHGRRGWRRILLGSQTSEVLAGAAVPVLVVR